MFSLGLFGLPAFLNFPKDSQVMLYNMGILEIASLSMSSAVVIVLSKTRLHFKTGCASCSYNEHNIDLSKLNEEKAESDDERYDDVPLDSFKTLPPPVYHPKPLPAQDLRIIR